MAGEMKKKAWRREKKGASIKAKGGEEMVGVLVRLKAKRLYENMAAAAKYQRQRNAAYVVA